MREVLSHSCHSSDLTEKALTEEISEFLRFNVENEKDANNEKVAREDEILLEVDVKDTFILPPHVLNEMQNQNIIVPFVEVNRGPDLTTNKCHLNISQVEEVGISHRDEVENEIIENEGDLDSIELAEVTNDNEKRKLNSRREETKTKRLKGEKYIGYSRSQDGKIQHNVQREKKQMKNRCSHKTSQKQSSRTLMCGEVSEETRMKTFNYFWNLESWDERKSYIRGLVSTKEISRRRKNVGTVAVFRKKQSHDCFLPLSTGRKVLVCRDMLLSTLALGRNTFERWTTNIQPNALAFNASNKDIVSNETKTKTNSNVSKLMKQDTRQWLKDLPKVPSHYCRSSSKKLYLESVFRSTLHVYKEYKKFCLEQNKKPVGRTLFQKILKSEAIAIHKPRKDQCDICCSWKTGNISEEDYNTHIKKKNEAEIAKRDAKESMSEEKLVVTMDLQSVLLAPKLEASAVYYKQKLQIHNFTVFALNNKNVDLYVWHESNGGVSANEFTTCIVEFIKITKEHQNYNHITLISDGCGYQNRNKVLSSALLKLSQELNITIEQLILERGHTMMEADAVHSSLEAYFKPPIYAPSDYVTRMRQARDHHPYRIHNLNYSFFLNYEQVEGNLTTIKPEKNARVTDIRGLLYLPTGIMQYRLNHSDAWTEFVKPRKSRTNIAQQQLPAVPRKLFEQPIKISKQKYDHLQELKKVIEIDYHPFYDSLPHN